MLPPSFCTFFLLKILNVHYRIEGDCRHTWNTGGNVGKEARAKCVVGLGSCFLLSCYLSARGWRWSLSDTAEGSVMGRMAQRYYLGGHCVQSDLLCILTGNLHHFFSVSSEVCWLSIYFSVGTPRCIPQNLFWSIVPLAVLSTVWQGASVFLFN